MTTTVQPEQQYRVIVTRPMRKDGMDKTTGLARYGADINLLGILYAKALRSSHSHARIHSIETRVPGVGRRAVES